MKLIVEYGELKKISIDMKQDKENFEVERAKMLDSLERMKSVWEGIDFDKFYEKAYDYVSRMEVITEYMNNISEFLNSSEDVYKDQDDTFSRELDKEVALNNEPEETYY